MKELLARQVTGPVRWEESVQCMVGLGVDRVVEIGAGNVLAGLGQAHRAGRRGARAPGDPARHRGADAMGELRNA